MKGKDLYTFVRFGGVNLKKQKGYSPKPLTFHAPPAARGFYAMPKVAQEMFLVSSIGKYQEGTMPKEPKYNEDISDEEWGKIFKDYYEGKESNFSKMRKEFRKTDGFVWHHLSFYCLRKDIVDEHGSWIKTSIRAWEKAFRKMSLNHRYGLGDEYPGVNDINQARGIMGLFSKDHCEVFFDEKV